jgi:hypothetical protein
MSGCQFSSQFSVNGWLILVQTPCERKLYAKGPLPPPLFQTTTVAIASSKTVPRKPYTACRSIPLSVMTKLRAD